MEWTQVILILPASLVSHKCWTVSLLMIVTPPWAVTRLKRAENLKRQEIERVATRRQKSTNMNLAQTKIHLLVKVDGRSTQGNEINRCFPSLKIVNKWKAGALCQTFFNLGHVSFCSYVSNNKRTYRTDYHIPLTRDRKCFHMTPVKKPVFIPLHSLCVSPFVVDKTVLDFAHYAVGSAAPLVNGRVPLSRFNSPFYIRVSGLRSSPQWIPESIEVDYTVPHSGFHSHAQWILESRSWISESSLVYFWVPVSGFCSSPLWIAQSLAVDSEVSLGWFWNSPRWIVQSPSVNCTAPRSGLRSPTLTSPSSVEDMPSLP